MAEFKSGFISIIGRPNVGKSTLSNELLGQKVVITSHKAQTTRHKIQLIDTTDNYQMVLLDTPGIHLGENKAINAYMNKTATSALIEANIVVWLVEADIWKKEDEQVLNSLKNCKQKLIIVVNKIDRVVDNVKIIEFLKFVQNKYLSAEIVPLSCFNHKDIIKLKKIILNNLPSGQMIFSPEYITTHNENFIISEFIREKLMRNLASEVPYNTTVMIDRNYTQGGVRHIYATIFTAKKTHKNIIIGKQGEMLKKISTDSRITIEGFLEQQVFLKLWIKVKENWLDNKALLSEFGYK
jgi:GTP-binding protein Era